MDNIFSELKSLGLGKMSNLDLFGDSKEAEAKAVAKPAAPEKPKEEDLILDKSFKCPLCDYEFKSKVVKTGKAKLVSQDLDLRPRYADIDSLKYGVIACPICGYSAMIKTFPNLGSAQAKLIKEQISVSFTGFGPDKAVYSYDDAITRHKLALVNSVVKRAKTSERAYMCLLIAWLTRGKKENLPADTPNRDVLINSLNEEEKDFLGKAREGFKEAFTKEDFPLCGLDEHTSTYLISALCAETGCKDEALRWASRLIGSSSANDRIKERARNIKEMLSNGDL